MPAPRRSPSRLGLALTGALLIGLLFWRLALPASSPWLDLVLLAAVGALLLGVRALMQGRR